jgi:galactose oxidase
MPLHAGLAMTGLADPATALLKIVSPGGGTAAQASFQGAAAGQGILAATPAQTGFHSLHIALSNAAAGPRPPYTLSVTYTGSRTLPKPATGDAVPTQGTVGETDPVRVGEWSAPFDLPNVPIHSHLLPDGKVLFWGRRDRPDLTLDEHFCTPQIWDPGTGKAVAAAPPKSKDGNGVNLFCSGHSFLPDGRLFVAGGHFKDSEGIDQASTYDFRTNTWTALDKMNNGRWYPSALTMADGTILVLSGSFAKPTGSNPQNNNIPQVWDGAVWRTLASFPGDGSQPVAALELFPCTHVAPDGRAFMSGPLPRSWFLNTTGSGTWTPLEGNGGVRDNARRDYAPSVMYDVGKIVYIGGGNNPNAPAGKQPPTSAVETIDLTHPAPAWRLTGSMHFPRRQHNATLLPDGTVLVTGGTSGFGFNDLDPNFPVHQAELWDPKTCEWTVLASEAVDRCYHSTAVLLPDATVLSGGGGEYRPDNIHDNPPGDTHRNAQIFRPPYLFRGPRPQLAQAPANVGYQETFAVDTPAPADIAKVSFIRLASTTHTNNMNQRINFLEFAVENGKLMITSPARPQLCPPGHYMLFLLDKEGRPSEAKIVRIASASAAVEALARAAAQPVTAALAPEAFMSIAELDAKVIASASGTHAVIGLTSKCPYGLGACWGGAFDALVKIDGVSAVRPIANAEDSTADVYLHGDTLPDVDRWAEQIASVANGSYDFRGVEVSVKASVRGQNGGLGLTGTLIDKPVVLAPLDQVAKVQFDRPTGRAKVATVDELAAYQRLLARYQDAGTADLSARVTGPLRQAAAGWTLHVRDFEA